MNTTKQNIKKFKEVRVGDTAYHCHFPEKAGTIIGVHIWDNLPNWAKKDIKAYEELPKRKRKKGKYVIVEDLLAVPQEIVYLYNYDSSSVFVIKNPDEDCPVEALKAHLESSYKYNITKQGNELTIYTGDKFAIKVQVLGWHKPE